MARTSETWTPEQRQQHGEAMKANWAARRGKATARRILVRNTVHIFKECQATLDVLRRRFEFLSEQLRMLDEGD